MARHGDAHRDRTLKSRGGVGGGCLAAVAGAAPPCHAAAASGYEFQRRVFAVRTLARLNAMASIARLPLIACSLDATGQQDRLAQWRDALAAAASREKIPHGVRYTLAADAQAEQRIRDLAAAEQACCSFLDFDVIRHTDHVLMSVTAPADGLNALRLIFPA